jgi:hypothetical protein
MGETEEMTERVEQKMRVTDVKDGNHDKLERKEKILRKPEMYNERNTENRVCEH